MTTTDRPASDVQGAMMASEDEVMLLIADRINHEANRMATYEQELHEGRRFIGRDPYTDWLDAQWRHAAWLSTLRFTMQRDEEYPR